AGDGLLVVTAKGPDGRNREHAIPEVLTGDVSGGSIRLRGIPATDILGPTWPAGSGTSRTLQPEAFGLLSNGGFDFDTVIAGRPDGWTVSVGTIGTTLRLTSPEVQTVAISGSPTGGH